MVEQYGGQLGVVGEREGQGGGGGGGLERGLDEGGPDEGRGGGRGGRYVGGGAGLDQLGALGHVAVVLDDSLDDLVLVQVQGARALVVLDFVLQDGVSFTNAVQPV